VIEAPDTAEHGLIARDAAGEPLCFGTLRNACISALRPDVAPQLIGAVTLPMGVRRARSSS